MLQLPKISTSNNWTQVYHILKQNILQRKFGANEKIAIPELAEQLGVSPTPIRDALNRLEAEGLIRTVPKVGTFVAPISRKHAEDMIETRLMMEIWIIERWPLLSEVVRLQTLDSLTALCRKASMFLTPERLPAYFDSDFDHEFHMELIRSGNNDTILDSYANLMNYRVFNLVGEMITLDMFRASWKQHEAIVEALSSGDLTKAKRAVQDHLESSQRNLLHFIEQSGGQL